MIPALAEAVTHGAAPPPGMPQFDTTTYAPQLIWLALMFGAFYLIMSRIALPGIVKVLEERSGRIKRDLETATRLKGETDRALAAYEAALAEARGRASSIAKETRERLAAETDRERANVEGEISAKIADAETRIAETKAKALASVSEIAVDTAGAVVAKLTGEAVGADIIRKALPQTASK